MAPRTIVRNARIFTSTDDSEGLVDNGCLIVDNGLVEYAGPDRRSDDGGVDGDVVEIDAGNRVLCPGFIDSHVHILQFGLSLAKVDVMACASLDEIRYTVGAFARANEASELPRILCRGWIQASTNGQALASMLDDLDPRPIYIEALDLHSVWCNSAALEELGLVDATVQDPPGGRIHRDSSGRPSGLLDEGALFASVWPFLAKTVTAEQKQAAIHRALTAYTQAGYTGVIDMSMDADEWEALEQYYHQRRPPLHIAAHWLIPYSDKEHEIKASLDKAIEMHAKFHPAVSPSFCVVGIKLIGDGVVDSCTAALSQPYGGKPDPVEPIWPAETAARVIRQADAAGLQCAVHAIGDRTISQTIDAIASLKRSSSSLSPSSSSSSPSRSSSSSSSSSSSPSPRHRIEHLELASEADARRLGELGIVASVQPVHSDPALFKAWPALLGHERCGRAFAYGDFLAQGAPLAFGTDAPTSAHLPLPNLYTATTRRSAVEPASPARTNPRFAVPLAAALRAVTAGAAYSRHAEAWLGSLRPGARADFLLLDMDWAADRLLQARVCQTWFGGRRVFSLDS